MGIGFTSKSRSTSNGGEGWGMGFLLVFFPDEDAQNQRKNGNLRVNLSRTNTPHLLHRAQSIISVCLILLFITVLLFTVTTLPSSSTVTATSAARRLYNLPRRQLSSEENTDFKFDTQPAKLPHALQGMGVLYRRGTKSMADLVVAHASESLTPHELKLFLRLFLRSPLAARSDLVLMFPARKSAFDDAILQERDRSLSILTQYAEGISNSSTSNLKSSFDATPFLKSSKREKKAGGGEPIWGNKIKTRFNSSADGGSDSPRRLSLGSMVGFEMDELDPENSLSGFMDHVPSSLRRWACYPMLLGRVRRSFKHIILVDLKDILLLDDPMTRIRSQKPESVVLTTVNQSSSKKKSGSARPKSVHPGIIMGGSRGIRRLSAATLNYIVRASMQQHQRKKRNPVSDMGIFNQIVENVFVLGSVNLIRVMELVPDLSSLGGASWKSGYKNLTVVRRGSTKVDVGGLVMKHICSFPLDSSVYGDCWIPEKKMSL